MSKIYYAKSPSQDGTQETVREHCLKVSVKAAEYGKPLSLAEEARISGLYHDFGKYSKSFQGVLNGSYSRIDHAFSGAALADLSTPKTAKEIVEAVNGHHDGLKSYEFIEDYINQSKTSDRPSYVNAGKASALSGGAEYNLAIKAIMSDFPDANCLKYKPEAPFVPAEESLSYMLDTRMLFSCLVDADYTVSSEQNDIPSVLNAKALLDSLYSHCRKLRESSTSDPSLNRLRDELFEKCGDAGESAESGLFTLTAPTGTGKTMALLHFALRHSASRPEVKRIIYVLPFLTLTEQSASAYSDIVPEILQDHSQREPDESAREHISKWDSPFIITTSVKFFQSLFSDRPSDCRKLHNIANSVIIFDEAQTLPANLTAATLKAIDRLCKRYGCTMVLSTATQPDYTPLAIEGWSPREILPNHAEMYAKTKRTRVEWRLESPTPLEVIACEMAREDNVCAIVNLRAHARELYRQLKEKCGAHGVYFLTTDLCPEHRTELVKELKARQKAGLVCRVVSTQCIEAGVDLDFTRLYRALAPLEAVIQAAGRCNRNGRMDELGKVTVFIPESENRLYPDDWYMTAAELVKLMVHDRNELEIHDPSRIREYYTRLFEHQRDKNALSEAIEERSYENVAKEYKLISASGYKVLVPYSGKLELYRELREEALKLGITASWLRRAAPLTVTTFERLGDGGFPVENLCYAKKYGSERVASDVYLLCTGSEERYEADMGLQLTKNELEFW